MLTLPPSCRIYLATSPCDMRRGFDGLLAEARKRWQDDPFAGHLFIFTSKDRTRLKIVWWSDGGLCLFAKRLEKGCFRIPKVEPGQHSLRLGSADLAMLLSGIDWSRVKRPQLYEPPRSLADRHGEKIDKSPTK